MRAVTHSLLTLVFLVGCSKKSGPLDQLLSARVLDGATVKVSADNHELVAAEVSWARPGFDQLGKCCFVVKKADDWLSVECGKSGELGRWMFKDGKLLSESANGAPERHWDWQRARAKEIAKALYSLR